MKHTLGMSADSRACAGAVYFCAVMAAAANAQSPAIQSIGPLSGDISSRFVSFSPEGHALVARSTSTSGSTSDFVWTALGGVQLAPAGVTGLGGVSSEGHFITGKLGQRAVRWDRLSGAVLELPEEIVTASQISGDGRTISGYGGREPPLYYATMKRWSADGGVSTVAYDSFYQYAKPGPISIDGTIASASITSSNGETSHSYGFYWNGAGTAVGLEGSAIPGCITPDSQFVYGLSRSYLAGLTEKYLVRWSLNGAMQVLVDYHNDVTFELPVGVDSSQSMLAMNRSNLGPSAVPSLWRPGLGYQNLAEYFAGAGINMTGWKLNSVEAMSYDGLVFAGNGVNPSGQSVVWVATIPAPSVLALLSTGMAACCRRRAR